MISTNLTEVGENSRIEIYDAAGSVVFEDGLVKGESEMKISLGTLPRGYT